MTYFAFRKTHLTNQEGSGEEIELSEKQRDDLMAGLAQLPFTHAQIIVLHYFRDISLTEIAKTLDLAPAVVHQMHYDALQRLKQGSK